jgi:hypothetical protein
LPKQAVLATLAGIEQHPHHGSKEGTKRRMTAKNKSDIMNRLLQGSSNEAEQETLALAKLIHRDEKIVSARKSVRKPSVQSRKRLSADASKKKSTHYLSGEIFSDLEEARVKIDEMTAPYFKARISKSRIVNQAIRMILKDFEEKGENSHLIKEILKDFRRK